MNLNDWLLFEFKVNENNELLCFEAPIDDKIVVTENNFVTKFSSIEEAKKFNRHFYSIIISNKISSDFPIRSTILEIEFLDYKEDATRLRIDISNLKDTSIVKRLHKMLEIFPPKNGFLRLELYNEY